MKGGERKMCERGQDENILKGERRKCRKEKNGKVYEKGKDESVLKEERGKYIKGRKEKAY